MDIGIPIPNITPPSGTEAIEETARAADALGFHSVWLAEHVIRPLDAYAAGNDLFTWDLYDPYVTAGFVAAHTKSLSGNHAIEEELGTGEVNEGEIVLGLLLPADQEAA